jgi:hypothetical protein
MYICLSILPRLPLACLPECLSIRLPVRFCLSAFPTQPCPPPALFPSTPICHLPVCLSNFCIRLVLVRFLSAYLSASLSVSLSARLLVRLLPCPNLLPARASTACQPPPSLPVCKSSSWSSACLCSCFLILQAVSVYRCSFCFCKALYKFLAAQCTPIGK